MVVREKEVKRLASVLYMAFGAYLTERRDNASDGFIGEEEILIAFDLSRDGVIRTLRDGNLEVQLH